MTMRSRSSCDHVLRRGHQVSALSTKTAKALSAGAASGRVRLNSSRVSVTPPPLSPFLPNSQPNIGRSTVGLGQRSALRQIGEAGEVILEEQLDGAGRAVALLADDRLGDAVDLLHLLLPLLVFHGAGARLLVLQVVLLAEDEEHHVGVLLDRARLAQIGELRALVLAVLDLPRELRQRQNGNVKLLGERLQLVGDLGDFLDAVVGAAARGALEELDVVDDDEVEAALALQAAGAGGKLGDGEAAGLVDEERRLLHLASGRHDRGELVLGDAAAP